MAEIEDRSAEQEPAKDAESASAEDTRKPYEPPRLTKKRSVARATLFSPMGPTMAGM